MLVHSLSGSSLDYLKPKGRNIIDRVKPMQDWIRERIEAGHYHYDRTLLTPPVPHATILDAQGVTRTGINFAVQDYLSLSTHSSMKMAVNAAIDEFGVHSAGSAGLLGNSALSRKLEKNISDKLKTSHALLFPIGWAAGYGVINGLVRAYDHVVIDQLAHACLQSGAMQATRNIHKFSHNSLSSLKDCLDNARSKDTDAAILVVTESLFSMDADSPDIRSMQELASSYDATFVVDVAHCFGNMGNTGAGVLELQDMLGKVDVVMGSFSKTFASIGGFVASNHPELLHYLRWFSGPWTFSNGMTPIQASVINNAFEIINSNEGVVRRGKMLEISVYLRDLLTGRGFEVLGNPCAIVPVVAGDSALLRIATNKLAECGVLVNMTEFPVVPLDKARFRLQVMSDHTFQQIEYAVNLIERVIKSCER